MIPNFMKKKLQFSLYLKLIFLFILLTNTQKLFADELFQKEALPLDPESGIDRFIINLNKRFYHE
mgnify:CR=1 FL=1